MRKFDLDIIQTQFPLTVKEILIKMGILALDSVKDNFSNESFGDKKWAVRKSFKYEHPILDKTNRLKNSFSVKNQSLNSITVGTDVEYADYHDTGTDKMAQRELIGTTDMLDAKIMAMIDFEMQKLFL